MPFCTQCGRPLAEGETCECRSANTQAAPDTAPQQPYNAPNSYPPPQAPYGGQPYPAYGQMPPQKKSNAWILAIIIPAVCVVLLLMLAILLPASMGYVKRSKQVSKNTNASTICKAANTAMVELDEQGEKLKGQYIISSDSDKNLAVPFNIGKFNTAMDKYLTEKPDYEYFMVIKDGTVQYAAISESWDSKKDIKATCPAARSGPRYYDQYGSGDEAKSTVTLTELYRDALQKAYT